MSEWDMRAQLQTSLNQIISKRSVRDFEVYGADIYSWSYPFVLGAGSYKLSILEIKDNLGNTVLGSFQLKPYVIYLFVGARARRSHQSPHPQVFVSSHDAYLINMHELPK